MIIKIRKDLSHGRSDHSAAIAAKRQHKTHRGASLAESPPAAFQFLNTGFRARKR